MQIHQDLVDLIFRKDWKLDASMTAISEDSGSRRIDPSVMAEAVSRGLCFDNMQTREEAIAESFAKTYSWILEVEPRKEDGSTKSMWHSFPKWLGDESNNVYWITGKPGSGKSTMMKYVVKHPALQRHLDQWAGPLPFVVVSYYAWQSGYSLQKSLQGFKRTVIFHTLERHPELAPILSPRRWVLFRILRTTSAFPGWYAWEVDESFDALLSECGKSVKLAIFMDGLDEFEVPASEVVELLREARARGTKGLKLCVASRPWAEFDDEFNENPMLEMHRLTRGEMAAFVEGKLHDNKGFGEQKALGPHVAEQLLSGIVDKANGVFLWASIVVNLLHDLFIDGLSIADAEKVLTELPGDISSLYDAIWASIRAENRPTGSFMIQVMVAAGGPLPWIIMWLVEESRSRLTEAPAILEGSKGDIAKKSLKRKLTARTKGILELSGAGNSASVNFIHRTARDWMRQPLVWQRICSVFEASGHFEPHLALLQAETVALKVRASSINNRDRYIMPWTDIIRTLQFASDVPDRPENTENLIRHLDSFDTEAQRLYIELLEKRSLTVPFCVEHLRPDTEFRHNNFLGLVAQFSILPYIRAKSSNRSVLRQQFSEFSPGLLDNAVLGFSHFLDVAIYPHTATLVNRIPHTRRLATVQFLLDHGVNKITINAGKHITNLRSVTVRTFCTVSCPARPAQTARKTHNWIHAAPAN